MDMVAFLYLLHTEIGLTKHSGKKYMIHFPSPKDYYACKTLLKQMKFSHAHLSKVRDLGIIRSFSCKLRSDSKLREMQGVHVIREDARVSVHQAVVKKASNRDEGESGSAIIPWGVDFIDAPGAWSRSLGQRIKIGVIDTGIDYKHPDLRNAISRGVNLLNPSLLPLDDNGHGTHIAGTIAASSRNSGILGVAPKASIYPVKAFDYNGSAYVSDIIAGIDWCVQNDLDVINMSFGMKTYNSSLEQAIINAYRKGKVVVASSGNDGKHKTIDYPARFPQVVGVGATTPLGKIAPFSNRGKQIDVYAPGERILSSWLNGKYNELSGTSMATAHVSGVVALMLSIKPGLKPLQIKNILRRCSGSLGKKDATRWRPGQINARKALNALK